MNFTSLDAKLHDHDWRKKEKLKDTNLLVACRIFSLFDQGCTFSSYMLHYGLQEAIFS